MAQPIIRLSLLVVGMVATASCGGAERPGPKPVGSESSPSATGAAPETPSADPHGPLRRCFAAAYARPDVEAELARCEEEHFGLAWRRELPPAPDPGSVGWIAPGLVQAVVRSNFDLIRPCYLAGLDRYPALAGRVLVHASIDASGRVVDAADYGSDLRDAGVVACIVSRFATFRFPKPERGSLVIVYPFLFGDLPDGQKP